MSNETLTVEVWRPSPTDGSGHVKSDIFGQALLQAREDGKVPQATLPGYELVDAKPTKRDGVAGKLFHVQITFQAMPEGSPTVSVDELVIGMQPVPFNPSDVEDDK